MSELVTIHTDGGATADEEMGFYGGWGVHIEDGDKEILIYGATKHGETNNRAEMKAYIRAMKWVIENKKDAVRFILDSKYVIEGAQYTLPKWEASGWITSQGKAVKNKDLWVVIGAYQHELNNAGISYKIDWVKGHSGHHGNEMADQGATKGTALSRISDWDERIVDAKTMIQEETEAKAAKKKVKVADPFGLLCGRRMFEMVNSEKMMIDGQRAYMTVSYDDTDPIKARGLGVMAGDRFEGLVVPNETVDQYEEVLAYHESLLTDSLIRPTIIYWDKLKASNTWKQYAQDGLGIFLKKGADLILTDKASPITQYLNPPRQARRCLEQMIEKSKIIRSIRGLESDKEVVERIDITDMFFETNDKGKKTIRADIAKEKSVCYSYEADTRTAKIIMTFDLEIPGRNSLAKAFKQGKDIKCELVITDRTENSFRWHLYVETPVGYGIFNNPSTNLYILPH